MVGRLPPNGPSDPANLRHYERQYVSSTLNKAARNNNTGRVSARAACEETRIETVIGRPTGSMGVCE